MTSDDFERVRSVLSPEPRHAHRLAHAAGVSLVDAYQALVRLYDLGQAAIVASGSKADPVHRWVLCSAECRRAA